MAIKREDLLKFTKSVEFGIELIEDDSSGGEDGTEVKILHLTAPVNAVGSNPTPEGKEMKLQGNKVYVGAANIDKFLEDVTEKDGKLVYKGPMHLDVSKPNGRMQGDEFVITKPAKIWLTATKFSKGGAGLQQAKAKNLNSVINKLFNGAVVDLGSESNSVGTATKVEDPTANAGAGAGPAVVANQKVK